VKSKQVLEAKAALLARVEHNHRQVQQKLPVKPTQFSSFYSKQANRVVSQGDPAKACAALR